MRLGGLVKTLGRGGAAYAIDEHSWTRSQAAWRLGGTIFVCGIPVAFRVEVFGLLDTLTTNYLLPLGGLLVALFTGWVLSSQERRAGFLHGEISPRMYRGWVFCLRVTIPLALGLLLLSALG
jgi:NSS family neurotransmitter:Na+ symporter